MTDKQIQFDQVFRDFGGILITHPSHLNDNISNAKLLFEDIVAYLKMRYSNLPDVYFDFIDNYSFNAHVRKGSNSEYYLGVRIGVFYLLEDMYNKMFSKKSILPLIDSEYESEEESKINMIFSEGLAYDNFEKTCYPKSFLRQRYSNIYTAFAFRFLIMHEFGHIIRGHVDYKLSSHGESWNEYQIKMSTHYEPIISQTLEMDADSFATNHAYIIAQYNIVNETMSKINFPDIFLSLTTFYRNWGFAIYAFMRLQGFEELDIISAKSKSHPPASTRLSMIGSNIVAILKRDSIVNIEEIIDSYSVSILDAEIAFAKVSYFKYSPLLFLNNHNRSLNYVTEIAEKWNEVRPFLLKYAYGELPPFTESYKRNEIK